jgi:phosphotransferase system enzyme I (PtsI)
VVDGTQGVVIVNPDRHVLAEYRLKQNQARLERDKLKRLSTAPAATLDGTPCSSTPTSSCLATWSR